MKYDIFDVKGKVIVITGGLGQLGRQFSLALVERGARVAIFDVRANYPQVTANISGNEDTERNILHVLADVTSRPSIEDGLSQVRKIWGVPSALINNAALDSPPDAPREENGPFESYPQTSWDKVMEVNVTGTLLTCQVIGDAMAKSGGGSIVNVSSIYGLVSPDQRIYAYRKAGETSFFKPVAYSVSKAAILNLTRYLATYWATRNVRVNTVTLGGVFNYQDRLFLDGYCAKVPMGRMAREDEYNGAIIFLVSDASSYMTGSNLIIDGGWTAW